MSQCEAHPGFWLQAKCPKLESLRDDFRHQAGRYKIVSCLEQRATRPLNCLVREYSMCIKFTWDLLFPGLFLGRSH
jgi:hypothetical protein